MLYKKLNTKKLLLIKNKSRDISHFSSSVLKYIFEYQTKYSSGPRKFTYIVSDTISITFPMNGFSVSFPVNLPSISLLELVVPPIEVDVEYYYRSERQASQ